MSAVLAAPKPRKVGKPVMLTAGQINARRSEIERTYGTRSELERRKELYPLNADEFWALQELEDLDWLEGR